MTGQRRETNVHMYKILSAKAYIKDILSKDSLRQFMSYQTPTLLTFHFFFDQKLLHIFFNQKTGLYEISCPKSHDFPKYYGPHENFGVYEWR